MDRRSFLLLSSAGLLSGCVLQRLSRVDPDNVLIRSDVFDTLEEADAVVKRAKLEWAPDGRTRILYVVGSPYDRGYQHGVLLRDEIKRNIGTLYQKAVDKFHLEELFDESYERMRPFIPAEYVEEMHGLAHGSKLPLRVIHGFHALPEIGEWGGKKKIKKIITDMMDGEIGTSCSNLCTMDSANADNGMYTVRLLDWGLHRISKLHDYPLITVGKPEKGNVYCNIGWVGFLGAVSGMNEKGITLGEMGYGDQEGETMRGKPMPFLLRDVMTYGNNLADVRKIISTSPGTNAFVYLMSDGKSRQAEMYIRDKDRFLVFKPGLGIQDPVRGHTVPGISDTVYGGHYNERMTEALTKYKGAITPQKLMKEIIPSFAMPSNFQNVIYDPVHLKFWVANAESKESRAADSQYLEFDLKAAVERIRTMS